MYQLPKTPADLATRGIYIRDLATSELWWHGPRYLHSECSTFDTTFQPISDERIPEQRKITHVHVITNTDNHVLHRFSDYYKLLRFSARCYRWLNAAKNKMQSHVLITAHEINTAEIQ